MNNVHAFKPREKQETVKLKAYRVKYSYFVNGIEYVETKKFMCLSSIDASIATIDLIKEIETKLGAVSEIRISVKPV